MIDLVVCNPKEKVEEPYIEELRNVIKKGFILE